MARRLAWLCGGIVAVGVLIRLGASWESKAPPKTDPARTAQPPVLPLSEAGRGAEMSERLLKDDKLTPPGPQAGEAQWRAYEETLRLIRENRDPLVEATPAPSRTEEFRKRVEARSEAARQRGRDAKERARKRQEEARKRREEHIREHEEVFGPRDRTRMPDPAFKAPPLGPPLVDDPAQPAGPK